MTYDRTKAELGQFSDRLDAYGADIERWPEEEQARAAALLDGEARARALLAEAKTFDALLAHAPLPAQGRQAALVDRILAQARSEAAGSPAGDARGKVIPWPGAAGRRAAVVAGAARRPAWQAAALLAASLAVGIFVGTQDLAPSAVEQLVVAAVDLEPDDETAAFLIGGDGLAAAIDEDFL